MKPLLQIVVALAVIANTVQISFGDDFSDMLSALRSWSELSPPQSGRYELSRFQEGKAASRIERTWYWHGKFKFAQTRLIENVGKPQEFTLLDNGNYFASLARSDVTGDKWGVKELFLHSEAGYRIQQTDKWPGNIGINDIIGSNRSHGIVAQLSEIPIESTQTNTSTTSSGQSAVEFEVKFVKSDEDKSRPQSITVTAVKELDWMPVKVTTIRQDGVIAHGEIEGWHKANGRWIWKKSTGYIGSRQPDPKFLAVEITLTPAEMSIDFDTKQCYLSYYGIPEPKIPFRWNQGWVYLTIGLCAVAVVLFLRRFLRG